jgi:hypothetical protein
MRKKSANVDIDFWPEHYRYYGEPFNINPQSAILIVLCDNCDENHACNYQNCQIVLDYKNHIQTIFLMNDHLTNFIRVHCRQTLGVIYDIHLKIIFDNNVYINDMYFFTHVTHQETIDFTVKKFCIFTPYRNKITIEIYRNKNYKMLTYLASGFNFFCFCHPFEDNNFYFSTNSKYVILSMPSCKPNFQYYILYKRTMPISLLHLSLSSLLQHDMNCYTNLLPKVVCENLPKCYLQHLLPWGRKYYNQNCVGSGPFSSCITDW